MKCRREMAVVPRRNEFTGDTKNGTPASGKDAACHLVSAPSENRSAVPEGDYIV
ncbi:hypothetical protein [Rosistilla carotiformis]|uniref:hypothetical protein n=1 Tax=Rosistilla carotiformis TaxID=2528017 RepID=UPI0018D208E8|nr:hypothetical protein [Rosistilla carotiformis]